jgi:mRNA-degrading endonuclease RelE of RelBE toxin-antitoxin system
MFALAYDSKAAKQIEKLPLEIGARIANKLRKSKQNPLRFFERLQGRLDYRLRVGKYRVIADIDFVEQKITVTFVGHRKNVYEKI